MTAKLRVLIVEDEPPARRRMQALLARHADVEVVGEACDGSEAVEEIHRLAPDLIFLDIELPVATGFEVIDAIGPQHMPPVIFVTAYDRHAIRAFQVHALDYLLKPVDPERLSDAVDRARAMAGGGGLRLRDDVRRAVEALCLDISARRPAAPARLAVKLDGKIRFIAVSEIDYVIAEENYARLRGRELNILVRETMTAMERKLTPHGFFRVRRGTLVRIEQVLEIEPLFQGEYVLRLKDGTRLVSGRTYRRRVQEAFALKDP